MPKPEISIIIPCYNCSEYLPATVESVQRQTMTSWELLLVDDCSDDNGATEACIRELAKRDSRIKGLRTARNAGPGCARNIGIEAAIGKYVNFVDSDDLIDARMLEKLLQLADSTNCEVAKCALAYMTIDGRVKKGDIEIVHRDFHTKSELKKLAGLSFGPSLTECSEDYGSNGSPCGMIISRDLLIRASVRFPEIPHLLSEDFAFCYEMLQNVRSYATTTEELYYYRENDSSRSRVPRLDSISRICESADYFQSLVNQYGRSEVDTANVHSFVIGMLRASLKHEFMSERSYGEKRKWFLRQQDYPVMRQIWNEYPWKSLPVKHRLGFELFYRRRFMSLYLMIVGQEKLRAIFKRQ